MNGMPVTAGPRRYWKYALMYAFAAACLLWVFHDVHPRQLLHAMTIANWWFLALAVAVDILTYILQGLRWQLLLAPVGRLGTVRATQAIYAGLFTNEVVPLRVGELVRGFLVSRWLNSGIGAVVPSMLVERFLDALWLAAALGLAAIFVPLPRNLVEAADVLGAIVLAATFALVWIVSRKEKALETGAAPQPSSSPVFSKVASWIARVAQGLREIGVSYRFYLAALLSASLPACQALAVWFMMLACGIRLPLSAAAVVFLVVRLGTAIPNAPANVGSFQFFTVLGMSLFGVDKTVAAAFSIVDFVALTAPLWIIGLFAIARTHIALSTLQSQVAGLRSQTSAR